MYLDNGRNTANILDFLEYSTSCIHIIFVERICIILMYTTNYYDTRVSVHTCCRRCTAVVRQRFSSKRRLYCYTFVFKSPVSTDWSIKGGKNMILFLMKWRFPIEKIKNLTVSSISFIIIYIYYIHTFYKNGMVFYLYSEIFWKKKLSNYSYSSN